jgi:Flp pilus assembly protein TadD
MKLVLTLVLLAGTTFLTWQEFRLAREVFWLNQAKTKPPFSPAQVEALEKAFAAEPKNFDTTYAIGEALRIQSFQGNDNYADLAKKAMEWYSLGMELNPYDGYNYLRFGMCLDWLGRYAESREYIMRATELDPNGYFTAMEIGWHYMENGDFAAARTWLHRSVILQSDRNQTAWHRMLTADRRLRQEAAKARSMATAEGPVNNFGE